VNQAQRWTVLVVCLLVAGVFAWHWYLGPLYAWRTYDPSDPFTRAMAQMYRAGYLEFRGPQPPNKPDNILLGIVLPFTIAGVGAFVFVSRPKGVDRQG